MGAPSSLRASWHASARELKGHPKSCHPVREPTFCRCEDEFGGCRNADAGPGIQIF